MVWERSAVLTGVNINNHLCYQQMYIYYVTGFMSFIFRGKVTFGLHLISAKENMSNVLQMTFYKAFHGLISLLQTTYLTLGARGQFKEVVLRR